MNGTTNVKPAVNFISILGSDEVVVVVVMVMMVMMMTIIIQSLFINLYPTNVEKWASS
jgi:hypothetical protein